MGNRTTKIEATGLAPRVEELAAQGISARRIATQVKSENPDLEISDSSVVRYVTRLRRAASDEAFSVIREHVDRVIPDDLHALEEMELQCLEWAREAGKDRIDRMADAAFQIRGELETFQAILESDDKDKEATVKKIIRRCLSYMAREDRLQLQRDKAMNTAIKIIDLKLRQAGLLDEEGKSPIYIVQREKGEGPAEDGDGYSPFRMQ